MLKRRREIFFLTSFRDLDAFYNANKELLVLFVKEFKKIFIVNSDNLRNFYKKLDYIKKPQYNLPKEIQFINHKNCNKFHKFCKFKNPLVINNIGRGFEFFRLLFFIRRRNIPQIIIGNVGNIQFSTYYWHRINLKIFILFFSKFLPRIISRIFVNLRIFNPIDIRFVSNKMIYNQFIEKKKNIINVPGYFKELVLVKSKIFDNFNRYKNDSSEKHILFLEMQPEYFAMEEISILNKKLVNEHYILLNKFLSNISRKLQRKVIISIHPLYNFNKAQSRFSAFKVIRMKTKELIKSAYLIIFYDSSAILHALMLRKKIICLRADLFKGRKFNSDIYKDLCDLKFLHIKNKLNFNKKNFINDLNRRTEFYSKYLKTYMSSDLPLPGTQSVIETIKKKFF